MPGMGTYEKFKNWWVGNDNSLLVNPPNGGGGIIDYDAKLDQNAGDHNDRETRAFGDVLDRDLNERLNSYHDYMSETWAYNWLLSRLRQELNLTPAEPDVVANIGDTIISYLPSHRVSRSTYPKTYTVNFEVDWDPQAFIREQGYEVEPWEAIGMALTLTGSTKDAQALSCAEYLTQTWPSTGMQILQLLQDVIRSGTGIQDLLDNTSLTARMQGSKLVVRAPGTKYSIAEIGEQLGWLGAALRSPPEKLAAAYCRP